MTFCKLKIKKKENITERKELYFRDITFDDLYRFFRFYIPLLPS